MPPQRSTVPRNITANHAVRHYIKKKGSKYRIMRILLLGNAMAWLWVVSPTFWRSLSSPASHKKTLTNLLTPAYTHNANPSISLTNCWNKISGHYSIICQSFLMVFHIQEECNTSQEEKRGRKMTREINVWEKLIIWRLNVGRILA